MIMYVCYVSIKLMINIKLYDCILIIHQEMRLLMGGNNRPFIDTFYEIVHKWVLNVGKRFQITRGHFYFVHALRNKRDICH